MTSRLDFEKGKASRRVHQLHGEVLEALTGGASIPERDTWPIKETAARAVLSGTASEGDLMMLGIEAQLAGTDVPTLAATVVAKSDAFKTLVGKAAGLRAKGLANIAACTSVAYVEATLQFIEDQVEAEIVAHS